jgi:hypothetical protein
MSGIIRYVDQIGLYNFATIGTTETTLQSYRDTPFKMEFVRHDQNNIIGYFRFQFNHDKVLGANLPSVHVHCIPCGANPVTEKAVRWRYYYTWQNSDGVFPALSGWTTNTIDMPIGTTEQYTGKIFSIISDITPPENESYSSWMLFMLERLGTDSGDTYTESNPNGTAQANLAILGIDCHYPVDGHDGSINEINDEI